MFGPEYPKIQTLWQRDERGVIVLGAYSTPELEYLAQNNWLWTEKVDGTNIRIHFDGTSVAIGGRTDNADVPAVLVRALQPLTDPALWHKAFGALPESMQYLAQNITLYGEGYGAKIRSGGHYRSDLAFVLFDVKVDEWWLRWDDVMDVAGKMGVEHVPVVGSWSLETAHKVIGQDGPRLDSRWPGARLEGIVGRPQVQLLDRAGDPIMVKLKYKDYDELRRRGAATTTQ